MTKTNKLFFLLCILMLSSCVVSQPKYYFYYSPSTYKKQGIEGYCEVAGRLFPATHILEHRLIREDAVFLGRGEFVQQDTFNRAIWPIMITR